MKNKQFKIPLLGAAVVLLALVFGSVFAFAGDLSGGVEPLSTSRTSDTVLYKVRAVSDLTNSEWSNIVKIEPEVEKVSYAAVYGDNTLVMGNISKGGDIPATFENDSNTLLLTEGWQKIESSGQIWSAYRERITSVYVLETIYPISTYEWFYEFKYCENWYGLNLLDMSKCTNASSMFGYAGYYATSFKMDLSNWNVSNITNMFFMFANAGHEAIIFNIRGLSNWDVSNVMIMKYMFYNTGFNSTTFNIGDLSSWDVSNVTNMHFMFGWTGSGATMFDIGDIGNWDVSNVTNISDMFWGTGSRLKTFNIGDLSNWDVSNVTNMSNMFNNAGLKASYTLDLSSWNVSKVTSHYRFNYGVESKVIAPTWVN